MVVHTLNLLGCDLFSARRQPSGDHRRRGQPIARVKRLSEHQQDDSLRRKARRPHGLGNEWRTGYTRTMSLVFAAST